MTDLANLKALCVAVLSLPRRPSVRRVQALEAFEEAANPAAVLDLIERVERAEAGWMPPHTVPDVERGESAYRIVAVKRGHSGKVATFGAYYLNEALLWFEYEGGSRPVTGWNGGEAGDDLILFSPLLDAGDELMGWREFPAWSDLALPPPPTSEGGE